MVAATPLGEVREDEIATLLCGSPQQSEFDRPSSVSNVAEASGKASDHTRRIEFEIVNQPMTRTIGVAWADDGRVELLCVVGAHEDIFASKLVATILADRILREGFVNQHVRRNL